MRSGISGDGEGIKGLTNSRQIMIKKVTVLIKKVTVLRKEQFINVAPQAYSQEMIAK